MDFAPHTERKFEKGSREQRLQQLEENGGHASRLRLLGRMTSSFVLDIRQPLAVIVTDCGTVQRLLVAGDKSNEKIEALLSRIIECARWADEVGGFADRMIARRTPTFAHVDLNSLGKSAVQFSQCESFSRAVPLHLVSTSCGALVLGDELQLFQVVVTLLVNAMQQQDAQATDNRPVYLGVADFREDVVLDIGTRPTLDTGIETNTLLATPADADIAICQSVVEAHRGSLECHRDVTGVLFRLRLPRVSDQRERY